MILELHRQGVSVSAIARQLGMDRKTVRAHIAKGLAQPVYKARPPRPRLIEPFAPYLRERIASFPTLTGSRLLRELRERGYTGGYSAVTDILRELRPYRPPGIEWLDRIANPRVHATTHRVVNEAFAEEKGALRPLPMAPYQAVLRLERRASHEGMVSIGGNLYSVPDTTRRRVFDVHVLADAIRIFEEGALVATHAPLEGRGQKRLDPAHRKTVAASRRRSNDPEPVLLARDFKIGRDNF